MTVTLTLAQHIGHQYSFYPVIHLLAKKCISTETLNRYPCASVHWNAAIFEVIRGFRQSCSITFHDNISNGSRVIVLTNKHTHKRTVLKTIPSSYAITAWVVIIYYTILFAWLCYTPEQHLPLHIICANDTIKMRNKCICSLL